MAVPQPFDGKLRWLKVQSTDQHGRFTFQGLRPGEYRVYAWDVYRGGGHYNLKDFGLSSVSVNLKEDAREQVELKLVTKD